MRLTLDGRARALLARLPRADFYALPELLLLGALAVQGARLAWAVLTPVGPLGAWLPVAPAALPAASTGFDPFFRLAPGDGGAVVTSVNLKLYGVRADRASGRGSAIIALPDGTQLSFAVGDEVVPGVRLDAVRLDGVTLLRGSAREQLFLDQSVPATAAAVAAPLPVAAAGTPVAPPQVTVATPAAAGLIQNAVAASPRVQDGKVTGFTLQPNGDGVAFRRAGLQGGDVLLSVNGQGIADAGVGSLPALLSGGQSATLEIERAGRTMTLTVPVTR